MNEELRRIGRQWPYWIGGYDEWSKPRHPLSNALYFVTLCRELRHSTMLEF